MSDLWMRGQQKAMDKLCFLPEMPCSIWRETRDPALDDAAFELDLKKRVEHLKGVYKDGI